MFMFIPIVILISSSHSKCNLNQECKPTKSQFKDFLFCGKDNNKASLMIGSGVSGVYAESLELLSSLQPEFTLDVDGLNFTISNCLLLHKLLATGQGEQVLGRSRRSELNQDLLLRTCALEYEGGIHSQVRCRIHLAWDRILDTNTLELRIESIQVI